jgi:hypothetical protein
MNTCSNCKYTVFTPAQLLHTWCEQRPSNKGNLDLNVMGEVVESLLCGGVLIFVL